MTKIPTIGLIFLLIGIVSIWAQPWMQGEVIKVSDGDTFHMMANGQKQKIRLYGVDCPESKQEFGPEAKRATDSLIYGKTVRVQILDTDRYGRIVGDVWINDTLNLNRWLVAQGYAWWYERYARKRTDLHDLEVKARTLKKGLWQFPHPKAPWDWRKKKPN